MGLLDGKTALIFGVANDHSIAWGIAKAFHAEGAEVGFSSVESLIEKRVRPLAESIGSTFIEPCDVQDDAQIGRVFAKWAETHDRLDILVHALAYARREVEVKPPSTSPHTRWSPSPARRARCSGPAHRS